MLRELIFAIRTDWFFLLGINFCDFQTVPSTQFWEYFRFYWVRACNRNTVNIFSNNKPVFRLFLNQRDKLWLNRNDFLFLCSEFKLKNIYSEVNFFGKNVCGNSYFSEGTYFRGSLAKSQKLQIRCSPYGSLGLFQCKSSCKEHAGWQKSLERHKDGQSKTKGLQTRCIPHGRWGLAQCKSTAKGTLVPIKLWVREW